MMKYTLSFASILVLQLFFVSHAQDNAPVAVTIKALPKSNASSKNSNTPNQVQYELRSEHPLTIGPGQKLDVNATLANLAIVSSEGSEPKLTVIQTLGAKDEDEAKKRGNTHTLEIDTNASGTKITSRLERKQNNSSNWNSHNVTLEISIPNACVANLETSVGNVSAVGLSGSIRLSTSAGNIALEKISGEVIGKSNGGNIEAESIVGELDLQTEGGNVMLSDIQGQAKVVTAGGNFVVDDYQGKFTGNTAGGNIRIRLRKQPQEDATIETGGGNIAVLLSKELKLSLKAATNVGRITSPFSDKASDKSSSRSKLNESLNGGGQILELSTSAGNISVELLEESK